MQTRTSFAMYARAASNLLFMLAALAVVLAVVLVTLMLAGDGPFSAFPGSGARGDVIVALLYGSRYLLIAAVFATGALVLRALAAYGAEGRGGSR